MALTHVGIEHSNAFRAARGETFRRLWAASALIAAPRRSSPGSRSRSWPHSSDPGSSAGCRRAGRGRRRAAPAPADVPVLGRAAPAGRRAHDRGACDRRRHGRARERDRRPRDRGRAHAVPRARGDVGERGGHVGAPAPGRRSARHGGLAIDRGLLRRAIAFGLRAQFATLFTFLLLRVDQLLVQRVLGFEELGLYALAVVLAELLWLATDPFAASLLPHQVRAAEGTTAGWASRPRASACSSRSVCASSGGSSLRSRSGSRTATRSSMRRGRSDGCCRASRRSRRSARCTRS